MIAWNYLYLLAFVLLAVVDVACRHWPLSCWLLLMLPVVIGLFLWIYFQLRLSGIYVWYQWTISACSQRTWCPEWWKGCRWAIGRCTCLSPYQSPQIWSRLMQKASRPSSFDTFYPLLPCSALNSSFHQDYYLYFCYSTAR